MLYSYQEVIIMAENKLADLSMDFAVKVLKMTDDIKGHYSLINQFGVVRRRLAKIYEKQNMLIVRRTCVHSFPSPAPEKRL